MMRRISSSLLFVFVASCAGLTPTKMDVERKKFSWDEPKGWENYGFPFPLYLSGEVKHEGHEELRLMPGFFNHESSELWSYAFAWWLKDARPVNLETLTQDLPTYYRGLCATDGTKPLKLDPRRYAARVKQDAAPGASTLTQLPHYQAYRAEVDMYECLSKTAKGEPIVLNFRIQTFTCGEQQRRVALFAISPKSDDDLIWKTLSNLTNSFRCGGKI